MTSRGFVELSLFALPRTNIGPENRPSQKEDSLLTIKS